MRDYNPRRRNEEVLNKIVSSQKDMHFGVLQKGYTAFTAGINKTIIVLSEPLLQTLNVRQAVAVLLHELGHQKNNDLALQLVGLTVKSAISSVSFMSFFLFFIYGVEAAFKSGAAPVTAEFMGNQLPAYKMYWQAWLVTQGSQLIIMMLVQFASRQRELMADSYAVINGYGTELIEALAFLHSKLDPKQIKAKPGVMRKFFNLFEAHPLLHVRVKNIKALASGSEGFVEDTLEYWLVAIPVIAGWFYGIGQILPYDQSTLFGLPALYVVGPIFVWLVYQLITTPFYVDLPKGQQSPLLVIAGLGMFLLLPVVTLAAIILAGAQLSMPPLFVGILNGALLFLMMSKKSATIKLLLTAAAIIAVIFVAVAVASLFFVF